MAVVAGNPEEKCALLQQFGRTARAAEEVNGSLLKAAKDARRAAPQQFSGGRGWKNHKVPVGSMR